MVEGRGEGRLVLDTLQKRIAASTKLVEFAPKVTGSEKGDSRAPPRFYPSL